VIFTRGDLVQHFQSDSKISERPLTDLMTLNQVTVHEGRTCSSAIGSTIGS